MSSMEERVDQKMSSMEERIDPKAREAKAGDFGRGYSTDEGPP